jgi:hypothetical protein
MLIGAWLIHTVTRKRRSGIGSKGDPSFGSATTVRARVEFTRKLVRSSDGKEVVSTSSMALLDEPQHDDIYWLPSVAGSPADDTASDDAGRTPISITGAVTKLGSQRLWMVYFG